MELVTGRAGSPHITAQQDRQLHQGIWGEGAYILNTGNMLEPVVQSSNKILIKDGALMYQGALFSVKVGTTDEITIDNGNQGMQRKDLVVARYTYNSAQNIESASWLVYKGTAVGSNPVLPSGISGDIQAGDNAVDVPYLAVTLDGINIVSVDVIPEVAPDIHTLNDALTELNSELSNALSLLSPEFTQIYSSANGIVHGCKIGKIAILRLSLSASESNERAINFNSDYAPAMNSTSLQLSREDVLLEKAILSRNDNGQANITFKAPSGQGGTYTGWVVYATYS